MIDYKTRIFYETETGMLGAEVKLYSEEGENIDNIIITSESKLKEIADAVIDIADNSIDMTELTNILLNATEQITINATRFQGYIPADFARALHSHSEYAEIYHASSQDIYGKGTATNYGHNKLVNNLTSASYTDGEALSAYQGAVLKGLIDAAKAEITKWEKVTLSGYDNIASYCTLYVNPALRLARLIYNRGEVKKGVASSKDSSNHDHNPSPYWVVGEKTTGYIFLHGIGAIPSAYRPSQRIISPLRISSISFCVDSSGGIWVHNHDGAGTKGSGTEISENILYHY